MLFDFIAKKSRVEGSQFDEILNSLKNRSFPTYDGNNMEILKLYSA
jgi:hypothetical protein